MSENTVGSSTSRATIAEQRGLPSAPTLSCWEILDGVDQDGVSVCHAGCTHAREVWAGRPAESPDLLVATTRGRCRVALSTVGVQHAGQPLLVHTMRELTAAAPDGRQGGEPGDTDPLSPRQLAVLELLDEGHRAREIAAQLGISETTVRNHVAAILSRLGCHSQLEAVAEARRRGIIGSDTS